MTADRVWPGAGPDVIEHGFVLTEDGVITAVGRVAEIGSAAEGAERTDLPGCTVVPGLINAHVHLKPHTEHRSVRPAVRGGRDRRLRASGGRRRTAGGSPRPCTRRHPTSRRSGGVDDRALPLRDPGRRRLRPADGRPHGGERRRVLPDVRRQHPAADGASTRGAFTYRGPAGRQVRAATRIHASASRGGGHPGGRERRRHTPATPHGLPGRRRIHGPGGHARPQPAEALEAATSVAAGHLGVTDCGVLEPGRRADLPSSPPRRCPPMSASTPTGTPTSQHTAAARGRPTGLPEGSSLARCG